MAYDAASFKLRWPRFTDVSDDRVTAVLAEATNGCSATAFGARFDEAVGLLAAHKLSVDPFDQPTQPGADGSRSSYLEEWKRLARQCAGGPLFAGPRRRC